MLTSEGRLSYRLRNHQDERTLLQTVAGIVSAVGCSYNFWLFADLPSDGSNPSFNIAQLDHAHARGNRFLAIHAPVSVELGKTDDTIPRINGTTRSSWQLS